MLLNLIVINPQSPGTDLLYSVDWYSENLMKCGFHYERWDVLETFLEILVSLFPVENHVQTWTSGSKTPLTRRKSNTSHRSWWKLHFIERVCFCCNKWIENKRSASGLWGLTLLSIHFFTGFVFYHERILNSSLIELVSICDWHEHLFRPEMYSACLINETHSARHVFN